MDEIKTALVVLAQCIDDLENIPDDVKFNKYFRTRKQLIIDILDGRQ